MLPGCRSFSDLELPAGFPGVLDHNDCVEFRRYNVAGIDPGEMVEGYRDPVACPDGVPAPDRNTVHGRDIHLRYGIFRKDRFCHYPPDRLHKGDPFGPPGSGKGRGEQGEGFVKGAEFKIAFYHARTLQPVNSGIPYHPFITVPV